jgi:hypothetical protein
LLADYFQSIPPRDVNAAEIAVLKQVIASNRAAAPALVHEAELRLFELDPASAKSPPPEEKPFSAFNFQLFALDDPGLDNLPKLEDLPLDQALGVARAQEYAGARASLLSELLDERGAEIDFRDRVSISEEILRDSAKMKPGLGPLILDAEIARWFFESGEKQLAQRAAQQLSESYDVFTRCEDDSCSIRPDNSPGELIQTFVEYLWEHSIEPAALGLNRPGLRSRWLLLELKATYEEKPQ